MTQKSLIRQKLSSIYFANVLHFHKNVENLENKNLFRKNARRGPHGSNLWKIGVNPSRTTLGLLLDQLSPFFPLPEPQPPFGAADVWGMRMTLYVTIYARYLDEKMNDILLKSLGFFKVRDHWLWIDHNNLLDYCSRFDLSSMIVYYSKPTKFFRVIKYTVVWKSLKKVSFLPYFRAAKVFEFSFVFELASLAMM